MNDIIHHLGFKVCLAAAKACGENRYDSDGTPQFPSVVTDEDIITIEQRIGRPLTEDEELTVSNGYHEAIWNVLASPEWQRDIEVDTYKPGDDEDRWDDETGEQL